MQIYVERLVIPVSKETRAMVEDQAKKAGLTLTAYARECLVKQLMLKENQNDRTSD